MPQRSYRQYCALARALDVVGDRWNLLIIRNLLLGPQTWSELRRDLPGIARNLLSARLSDLEEYDVVVHDERGRYALTERGAELQPAVFALAAWGERHVLDAPRSDDRLRIRYAMTSIRRRLRPVPTSAVIVLDVDGQRYVARLGEHPTVEQAGEEVDVDLRMSVAGFRRWMFAGEGWEELVAEGLVDGPADLARRLRRAVSS